MKYVAPLRATADGMACVHLRWVAAEDEKNRIHDTRFAEESYRTTSGACLK